MRSHAFNALRSTPGTLIAPPLYVGLLFLCTLPSTVQASVIFTSIAGGNVAAALCSASLSSIIGMALTPLMMGLLLQAHGESSLNGVVSIALQVLLPFVAGQAVQRWLEPWMKRNQKTVRRIDLGKGHEEYKRDFKNADVALAEGWVERRTATALLRRIQRAPRRFVMDFVLSRPTLRAGARRALRGVGYLRTIGSTR